MITKADLDQIDRNGAWEDTELTREWLPRLVEFARAALDRSNYEPDGELGPCWCIYPSGDDLALGVEK